MAFFLEAEEYDPRFDHRVTTSVPLPATTRVEAETTKETRLDKAERVWKIIEG